jgi:hypothetical protein
MHDNITGGTYLEHGKPVKVLVRWGNIRFEPLPGVPIIWLPRSDGRPHEPSGPRNVLIERAGGSRVVRPFRGLRRLARD